MLGPFGEIAMAPDIDEALERCGRTTPALREGADRGEFSLSAATGLPSTSTVIPRPGPECRHARLASLDWRA